MTDELLAYLLDDLSPRRREEVELQIQSNPKWRREYERLRECFEASQRDADEEIAEDRPLDLVSRTCSLVDSGEYSLVDRCGADDPRPGETKGLASTLDAPVQTRRWTLADASVAVGVALVLFGLLSPALLQSRDRARADVCRDKMRQIGTRVYDFAAMRSGMLPFVPANALMSEYVRVLSKGLGEDPQKAMVSFVCPSSTYADDLANGKGVIFFPAEAEYSYPDGKTRRYWLGGLRHVFAFQSPRRDADGTMRPAPLTYATAEPILAHSPALTADGPVIAEQFVCSRQMLFADMSVRALKQAPTDDAPGFDHPFLNENEEHAARSRDHDATLIRGDVTPNGRTVEPILLPPAPPGALTVFWILRIPR